MSPEERIAELEDWQRRARKLLVAWVEDVESISPHFDAYLDRPTLTSATDKLLWFAHLQRQPAVPPPPQEPT